MYIILIIHNSSKEYFLIVDILCKYNVGQNFIKHALIINKLI